MNFSLRYKVNTRLAFKKLRTIAWRFTITKEKKYIVLVLHLLKPLFSVFHVLQALNSLCLVSDLYTSDSLEANKTQEICIFQ